MIAAGIIRARHMVGKEYESVSFSPSAPEWNTLYKLVANTNLFPEGDALYKLVASPPICKAQSLWYVRITLSCSYAYNKVTQEGVIKTVYIFKKIKLNSYNDDPNPT